MYRARPLLLAMTNSDVLEVEEGVDKVEAAPSSTSFGRIRNPREW
jgi:hypothetical protein